MMKYSNIIFIYVNPYLIKEIILLSYKTVSSL